LLAEAKSTEYSPAGLKAIAWILCAAVACGSAAPAVRTFAPVDRTSILAVLDAQVAAWNRGDLAGYMDGYAKTDRLIFTSGGHVRTGWQSAFDHYQAKYGRDRSAMGKLAFEVLDVQPLGADGAVVLGNSAGVRIKLDGEEFPVPTTGKPGDSARFSVDSFED